MLIRLIIILILIFTSTPSLTQNFSDYLILQDIGLYKLDKAEAVFPREPQTGGPRVYDGSGIIGATGHFPDHKDLTYEVMYIGGVGFHHLGFRSLSMPEVIQINGCCMK